MSEQPPNPHTLPPADEPQGYVGPDGRLVPDQQQPIMPYQPYQQQMADERPPLTDGRSRLAAGVKKTILYSVLLFVVWIVVNLIAQAPF